MTTTWSREVLLARLLRERYGDPEALAVEAKLPVPPKPLPTAVHRCRSCDPQASRRRVS